MLTRKISKADRAALVKEAERQEVFADDLIRLFMIEREMRELHEAECNYGGSEEIDQALAILERAADQTVQVMGKEYSFETNSDPRGFVLRVVRTFKDGTTRTVDIYGAND